MIHYFLQQLKAPLPPLMYFSVCLPIFQPHFFPFFPLLLFFSWLSFSSPTLFPCFICSTRSFLSLLKLDPSCLPSLLSSVQLISFSYFPVSSLLSFISFSSTVNHIFLYHDHFFPFYCYQSLLFKIKLTLFFSTLSLSTSVFLFGQLFVLYLYLL